MLRKLQGIRPLRPTSASELTPNVRELAFKALPLVRGFAQGQQQLDVKWPTGSDANWNNGVGFSSTDANPLFLWAALDPHELGELIMKAILDELAAERERTCRARQAAHELHHRAELHRMRADRAQRRRA